MPVAPARVSPLLSRLAILPTIAAAAGAAPPQGEPSGAEGVVAAAEAEPRRRNLLVVTLDTTRRDFMGFLGRTPSPTPHLDRLAAGSVVFEDAYTVVPLTLPAHASLFTGLYPRSHGVHENSSYRLPRGARTLAELLSELGFETGAAVAVVVLDPMFGLDQGFGRYDAPTAAIGDDTIRERAADAMVACSQEQLSRFSGRAPFFLWVHFYDPHFPYAPPPPFRPGARGRDATARELYEGEIRFVDEQVGRLVELVRGKSEPDDLVIVVASDHGESLGDAPESSHGFFLLDPTVRIPLLLHDPGLPARRFTAPVTLADVMPTLLGLLAPDRDRSGEPEFEGVDLSLHLRDATQEPPDRALLLESWIGWLNYRWAPFDGCVQGGLKYVRSRRQELFAPGADGRSRDETRNLFDPAEARSLSLSLRLDGLLDAARPLDRDPLTLTGDALARLLRLGYSAAGGGDGAPADVADLPDPYEKSSFIAALEELTAARVAGDAAAHAAILRRLLAQEPGSAPLLDELGLVLAGMGPAHLEEAARCFEEALRRDPRRASAHFGLAGCAERRADALREELRLLRQQGRPREELRERTLEERERTRQAIAALRACLEFDPRFFEAIERLAWMLGEEAERAVRAGDFAQAVAHYRDVEELLTRWHDSLAADHSDRPGVARKRDGVIRRREELERRG